MGWGQGGEMTQALYAHMNYKTIIKKKEHMDLHLNSSPVSYELCNLGKLYTFSKTQFLPLQGGNAITIIPQ
jgi:hypothetical protein